MSTASFISSCSLSSANPTPTPTCFARIFFFCNDLPDIAGVSDYEIHMYADDTTIYVAESSPDKVVDVLNSVL